jgi:hypothetical protein
MDSLVSFNFPVLYLLYCCLRVIREMRVSQIIKIICHLLVSPKEKIRPSAKSHLADIIPHSNPIAPMSHL